MQRHQRAVLQRPAQPVRREAEGGGRGQAHHLGRRDFGREQRADAVEERIAGRYDRHRGASTGQDGRECGLRRRWPGQRVAGHRPRHQREMPPAAHDQRGMRDQRARSLGQTGKAVFADSDD
jgi:hypothetical protein